MSPTRRTWTFAGRQITSDPGRIVTATRRGLTLPELLVSMSILGMMSVVLAGMSFAVQSAWDYTKDVEESGLQSDAALARIRYMLSQTGTYRVPGLPAHLGAAVVTRLVGSTPIPDTLVLWTGGRDGGLAAQGVLERWPTASELLIYTVDTADPSHVVEIAISGNASEINFAATDFDTTIASLLQSPAAEKIPLCERLRVSSLLESVSLGAESFGGSLGMGESVAQGIGCLRFELVWTPSDAELSSTSPQTPEWMSLPWPQGAVSSRSGVRQCRLNVELQVEPRDTALATQDVTAIPYFGSASVRYVYEP